MKLIARISLLALFCAVPFAARAQNGCVNSPENPTAVLALVGAAAAVVRKR